MRFPTQTRESPHFRASTRAIVKPFLVGTHGLLELHATGSRAQDGHALDRYGHLFPSADDGTELAAAEKALLR